MSGNMQRTIELAIAQNAHAILLEFADKSSIQKFLRANLGSLVEFRQIANDNDRELFFKPRIREAALGQAAVQRHLTALEAALLAASRTRPHTFTSTPCRLSTPHARTLTDPRTLLRGARVGSECV